MLKTIIQPSMSMVNFLLLLQLRLSKSEAQDQAPQYLERIAVEMRGQVRVLPVLERIDHFAAELKVARNRRDALAERLGLNR